MPRENKIPSTSPFLYDRQRQERDQIKGGRKEHYATNDDTKKKPKKTHNINMGCFAAVVAEDRLV